MHNSQIAAIFKIAYQPDMDGSIITAATRYPRQINIEGNITVMKSIFSIF